MDKEGLVVMIDDFHLWLRQGKYKPNELVELTDARGSRKWLLPRDPFLRRLDATRGKESSKFKCLGEEAIPLIAGLVETFHDNPTNLGVCTTAKNMYDGQGEDRFNVQRLEPEETPENAFQYAHKKAGNDKPEDYYSTLYKIPDGRLVWDNREQYEVASLAVKKCLLNVATKELSKKYSRCIPREELHAWLSFGLLVKEHKSPASLSNFLKLTAHCSREKVVMPAAVVEEGVLRDLDLLGDLDEDELNNTHEPRVNAGDERATHNTQDATRAATFATPAGDLDCFESNVLVLLGLYIKAKKKANAAGNLDGAWKKLERRDDEPVQTVSVSSLSLPRCHEMLVNSLLPAEHMNETLGDRVLVGLSDKREVLFVLYFWEKNAWETPNASRTNRLATDLNLFLEKVGGADTVGPRSLKSLKIATAGNDESEDDDQDFQGAKIGLHVIDDEIEPSLYTNLVKILTDPRLEGLPGIHFVNDDTDSDPPIPIKRNALYCLVRQSRCPLFFNTFTIHREEQCIIRQARCDLYFIDCTFGESNGNDLFHAVPESRKWTFRRCCPDLVALRNRLRQGGMNNCVVHLEGCKSIISKKPEQITAFFQIKSMDGYETHVQLDEALQEWTLDG